MPKLLQIDSCLGVLSTGKITESIAKIAMAQGWECFIMHGARCVGDTIQHHYQVSSLIGEYIHYAESMLLDRHGLGSRCATKKVIKKIKKIKPDIIQLHCVHGYYINYKYLFEYLNTTNIPIVWTFHDCWAFTGHCAHFVTANCNRWKQEGCYDCPLLRDYPKALMDRSNKNYRLKKQLFLENRNMHIVTVSEWLASFARESFLGGKEIRVINNGIDIQKFRPCADKIDNKFNILGVASTWNKDKGLFDFYKIREMLSDKVFDITLVGLTKNQVAQLPYGIKGITTTKSVNDLALIYSESNVLINPTYADSFPTINMEALACGTPVITYRTGGSPEIIDSKTGAVVEQGDIFSLANTIRCMKEHPLSANDCRERAESLYNKDERFMDYIRLYEELIAKMHNNIATYKQIRPQQVCEHCVMDTSDEHIVFDENGVCVRCREYEKSILSSWNHGKGHEAELRALINDIKRQGQGKQYDCILGLSGGLDSSYMLHLAVKEWGLRPYVFHIDAGWNLPVATDNINKICNKLGLELHVEKMDWEEMRQMQLAFFRTGHAGLDAPQDHAFIALIDKLACKLGVKYIMNGYNISTEIVSNPNSWDKGAGYSGDGTYIKDVLRHWCDIKIKKYTFTSGFKHKVWIPYVLGVKTLKPLNLVPVTKKQMIETLAIEYGYLPYGQKHFEDLLTKFLEGYWLPTRFGYDIRKAQLSSLVITGQMTREEALEILKKPPLSEEESMELFKQVAAKLEISEEELMKYHDMNMPNIKYKSQEWLYTLGIKFFTWLRIEKRIRK